MSSTAETKGPRGRQATSPWKMPLAGWKDVAVRTWREASKDNVGLVAAGVAFYAFLALVPMLGATVLTYGLVASPETVLENMQSLTAVMPGDIARLIGDQLLNVVNSSSGKKGLGILVALAIALFGARNAAGAIITALNIAYEEEEKRGFIKVTLLALAITAAAVIVALGGVAVMTALRFLESVIPGAPEAVHLLIKFGSIAALVVVAAAIAATLYRYAPSREQAKWTWLTPGTVLSATGWLALTAAFGIYVSRFANYNATYGSLGAVVALLTWTYLSSYIFLFGAELNSEFEHQTARDTTSGPEKPLGQREAWSADHVASGSDDEGKEAAEDRGVQAPVELPVRPPIADPIPSTSTGHPYLTSRATNTAARMAGLCKIGMASSAMATLGLSLLRKRDRAGAGAALLLTAAGLSLLKREPADGD